MKTEHELVVLGALLHDIGKLAQRAGRTFSRNLEDTLLPSFKGRRSHWHALYTDHFIETDLPLPEGFETSRSRLARIAAAHHRPDESSLNEMAVMVADRLSAGADRVTCEADEDTPGFRESRLVSVFDQIELARHVYTAPGSRFYELEPMEAGAANIFPMHGKPQGKAEKYGDLYERLAAMLDSLPLTAGFSTYLGSLTSLLEKFTWCVPSSTYGTLPDVSLFDHSYTSAAIAQALYLFHREQGSVPNWEDRTPKFLLLAADLSGIQRYIFEIRGSNRKGVTKIFRARSFYLQALTRSVQLTIEEKCNLYPVCRLVDAGGKFILLLPNTEKVTASLKTLEEEIHSWFHREFKGLLTLSLTWRTLLTHRDFQLQRFQERLDAVNAALEDAKLRKLGLSLAVQGPVVDHEYNEFEGGNCSLCEVNAADERASERYAQEESAQIGICSRCCEQILYLGTRLPRSTCLVYAKEGRIPLFGGLFLSLTQTPPSRLEPGAYIESLNDELPYARIRLAMHLPEMTAEELADERWFRLYQSHEGFEDLSRDLSGGKRPPAKTFGMIAEKARKIDRDGRLVGRPLLAFLKADVDNLGLLFHLGLGNKLSIARMAALSRMLNLFFTDYLVALLKAQYPDIYVVFAGGDDLFLVGPWRQTIDCAIEVRHRFEEFCAGNPDITLSCGIVVAKPRLPTAKAAQLAEHALDRAKAHKDDGIVKNTVVLLGSAVRWEDLPALVDLGYRFDLAVAEHERTRFSTGFLFRLLQYHRMYCRFTEGLDIAAGRYLSLAHYDIGRNIRHERADNKEELELLYRLFAVGQKERKMLAHLDIPLFYALNLNRKGT